MKTYRRLKVTGLLALGLGSSTAIRTAARADQRANAAATAVSDRVVMMERFVVSATRIDRSLVFAPPGNERTYLERLRAVLVPPAAPREK